MNSSKIQLLHDYLLQTKLVTAEQLEIWESDSKTFSVNTLDGSHTIAKQRQFQCNVLIENLTPDQSRDQIEFALIWWLNLYESDHPNDAPRFISDPDIEDRRVTDLWFGFKMTEKSRLENGRVTICTKPLMMMNPDMTGVIVFVRDEVTGEEEQLIDLSADPISDA